MVFFDSLQYITVGNPISKAIIGTTTSLFGKSQDAASVVKPEVIKVIQPIMLPLWQQAGRHYNFVRLAGVSGAAAVIMGALGSHQLTLAQDKGETKNIFDTANRFHFFHSLALLAVPLSKRPLITGSLFITGTFLFSGVLYYRAFTNDRKYSHYAPLGGTLLIIAWLTLLL